MTLARRRRRNPSAARGIAMSLLVGVATSAISGVIVALVVDYIRERRAAEPLPQPVAPGWDQV